MTVPQFFVRVPWPLYPAIVAWCIGLVIQLRLRKHIDHQKIAQMKITTFGHYLAGKPGTAVLTERGLRLHRWFLVCAAVFVVYLSLAALLYSNH
jgi:hypothetical protein